MRLALAGFLFIALACDGAPERSSVGNAGADMSRGMEPAMPAPAPPKADEAGQGGLESAAAPSPATPPVSDSLPPQMLIRTGDASVEVDSLEAGVAAVQALVARVGGHVGNTGYSGGRGQMREAYLQLRIPAQRFEEVQTALGDIGTVEYFNVSVQDVGEEYVDMTARLENGQRLERRLVELLATRTGKLEDVLAVERELARVRERIETAEGRLRYLRNQVALSTLTVRLHEPAPIIGGSGGSGMLVESFRSAWRNFVRFVAAFIASAGVWIPLVIIGAGVVSGVRWWRRRHQGSSEAFHHEGAKDAKKSN